MLKVEGVHLSTYLPEGQAVEPSPTALPETSAATEAATSCFRKTKLQQKNDHWLGVQCIDDIHYGMH
jgi:hypothetical protein